jgi:hypothetical protein
VHGSASLAPFALSTEEWRPGDALSYKPAVASLLRVGLVILGVFAGAAAAFSSADPAKPLHLWQ